MQKYKYAIYLTLIFSIISVILYYKVKSDKLEKDLVISESNYNVVIDKLRQQEKSIKQYKEDLQRQDEKLKELNDKNISYENKLNELKKEVTEFNIKDSIKIKPIETKKFINEKINKQFNELNELVK